MPKGEGASRLRRPGVDLLEGRLLLSRATTHSPAEAPAHVAPPPTPIAARPEVETRRPSATNAPSESAEVREAGEIASAAAEAASSAAKDRYTIPGLASGKPSGDDDDSEQANQEMLDSSRYLRVTYRDEPVAWGLVVGGGSGVGSIARHRVDGTPEIPEFAEHALGWGPLGRPPGLPLEGEGLEDLPAPEGSDLLADFLPSDRAALERAIDRLLEGLGLDLSRSVESTGLIPSPVAWGVALAVLEVIRRRLRRRAVGREERGQDRERDPLDGFLESLT